MSDSPQPDAILNAEEIQRIRQLLRAAVWTPENPFDDAMVALQTYQQTVDIDALLASHEVLRRRLADAEAERAAAEARCVDLHARWQRSLSLHAVAEAERERAERECSEWIADAQVARSDATAAEDRVRTLTEALTELLITEDSHQTEAEIEAVWARARAVLGSETSGEGTE